MNIYFLYATAKAALDHMTRMVALGKHSPPHSHVVCAVNVETISVYDKCQS